MMTPVMAGRPSHRVLVLNRLWQAVNIVDVPRAFSLLFQEHARVLSAGGGDFQFYTAEEWIAFSLEHPPQREDQCIHTVRLKIRLPSILLLLYYDRLPVQEVKFTRENLFERDGHTCQYCGQRFLARELNLDHVIPRDRGGRTTWENIATSCVRCNTRKGNRLPHEAGMRLIRKPSRPPFRPFVCLSAEGGAEEAWVPFLHGPKSAS